MSLRARLLLGLVALTAAGLVVGRHRHLRGRALVPGLARRPASSPATRPAASRTTSTASSGCAKGPQARAAQAATAAVSCSVRPAAVPRPAVAHSASCCVRLSAPTASTSPRAERQPEPTSSAASGASLPKLPTAIPRTTNPSRPKLVTVDSVAGSALQYRVLREAAATPGSGTIDRSRYRSRRHARPSPVCAPSS